MKTKFQILFALFTLAFVSCGEGEKVIEQSPQSEEIESLVNQAESLENQFVQGRLLSSMADRDKKQIRDLIFQSKTTLLRLESDPENRPLIGHLFRLSQELDQYQILRSDRPRLEKYFNELRQTAMSYAREAGFDDIQATPWRLYTNRFSTGTYPFGSVSEGTNWQADWSQDRPHVAVRSSRGQSGAWLVSPTFDLTDVEKPRLRIEHMIMLNSDDRNSNPFNRSTILNQGFMAKVSTNYNGGDPSQADWHKLDISPLPSSRNFHTVKSPAVDLTRFKGKNVTLALHYKMNHDDWAAGFVTWQVNEFELLGVGELGDYQVLHPGWIQGDLNYLFRHDFSLHGTRNFTEIALNGNPPSFQSGSHGGNSFVSISGFNPDGENQAGEVVLASPTIDLTELSSSVGVWVKQAINHYPDDIHDQELIRIVAFEDGKAQSPSDYVDLEFEEIPRGDAWNTVTSEVLKIPDSLQDKEIRVGFVYKATNEEAPSWQFYEVGVLEMPSQNQ